MQEWLHPVNICPKRDHLESIVKKEVDVMASSLNSNIQIKVQFIAADIVFSTVLYFSTRTLVRHYG